LAEDDFDGLFQLRIAPSDDFTGGLLDLDVGGDAFVLDTKPIFGPKGEVRSGDASAVHKDGKAEDSDETAPGAFADEGAEFKLAEHPGQQIAAGPGGFVNDHDFRSVDAGDGGFEVGAITHGPVTDDGAAQDDRRGARAGARSPPPCSF